jgi:hypothetical protein
VDDGRRAQKVDRVGALTANDMAMVQTFLFCYLHDNEQATEDPGVDGALAMAPHISQYVGLARRYFAIKKYLTCVKVFLGKSSTFRCPQVRCMRIL